LLHQRFQSNDPTRLHGTNSITNKKSVKND
jgi:hypothetical protein